MKNNKGFTLIELIAVVAILAIIAVITIPIVNNSLKDAKEKMLNEQIDRIIDAAKTYIVESDLMTNYDEELGSQRLVSIVELRKNSYLEDKDIVNPVTENVMNGCVLAKYEESKYNYTYLENCVSIEYTNLDRFIYPYDPADFNTIMLSEFLAVSGIDAYYPSQDTAIQSVRIDGVLIDKDDVVITGYGGSLFKTDSIELTMYIYQIISLYGDSRLDFFIDVNENAVFMGYDMLKIATENQVDAVMSELYIFNYENVQTIEDWCSISSRVTSSDCSYTALGNIKLDN